MSAVKPGRFAETLIAYHPGVKTMWIAGLRTFFTEPGIDVLFAEIDFETCAGKWLFNEGSGTVTEDFSGRGNDATIHGGAEWVDCMFGKALSLDGSDDYVRNCAR